MADFGVARDLFALSSMSKKPLIQYPSTRRPGSVLEFVWNKDHGASSYYKCNSCFKLWKKNRNVGTVPTITVKNGSIVTDPDFPRNPHFCNGQPEGSAIAQQIDRENREVIRSTGKKPRLQFNDSVADIPQKFQDKPEALRDDIQQHMKPYNSVRRSYQRALRVNIPHIDDVYQIPEFLKLTQRGRFANPGDLTENEQLILHENVPPQLPLFVLASDENLEWVRLSNHVICDGNFKFQPERPHVFAQMYTIHGFVMGECFPLVTALLPDKSQASYDELFNIIRNAVLRKFPDIGAINGGTWHFDYETAAINAFKAVFPEAYVAACTFHYAKALNAKQDELGLMVTYQQNPVVKQWIRRFVGLCMIPEWLVPHVGQDLIQNVPVTNDAFINHALQNFATYFEGFWLNPTFIPTWNSHSNMGPRTTNHAEGWHSALRFKFKNRHPDLGEWLVEMQKWHHSYAVSARNLLAGIQNPTPRRPHYVQIDQRLTQAKTNLVNHINTQIQLGLGPDRNIVLRFVDHVSHILGNQ